MHMYNKQGNLYGGAAIVGAHVPVGTGLAFYHRYMAETAEGDAPNVSMAFYGDGAANQGQCWEAANMASLWKLPMIFCIENNEYGMGTSVDRSSALTEYYKQGNFLPGIQIDGMNAVAVREGMSVARQVALTQGPVFVELKTYRYHGHSMSDPGTSYRTRDEVATTRKKHDPIDQVMEMLVDNKLASVEELKEVEGQVRKEVKEALKA